MGGGLGTGGALAMFHATGEIGVVGGSVPGVAGEGTSMSGPVGGAPGGAGVGCPGCGGWTGSGVAGGWPGVGGSSGVVGCCIEGSF